MNSGKRFSDSAVPPTAFATPRLAAMALMAALGAVHWGCMDNSSTSGSQSQSAPGRVLSSNPMCLTQTHLLILDRDVIANGSNCQAPVETAMENPKVCRRSGEKGHQHDRDCGHDQEKDDLARDAVERNVSKGGSGSHGGRGGSGGFEENSAKLAKAGAGGSGGSGGSKAGKGAGKCNRDKDPKGHKGHRCDKDAGYGGGNGNGNDNGGDGNSNGNGNGGGRDKVEVCHIPPGNPGNAHTIIVGSPALEAHLAHGDTLGRCLDVGPTGSCEKSFVGNRGDLLAFADKVGAEVTLPAGTLGDEGWFAITTVRIAWRSAGPDMTDGLRNYVEAGPGLGTANAAGSTEALLENVPNLTPLRATGLTRLEGRAVCAIVLDGEVEMGYNPLQGDISGPNLGKVAFQVLSVESASTEPNALPSVRVRILDADAVCGDPLTPYIDAPPSISPTQPPDVVRPSCAIQQNLISEPWDTFDSTKWRGDGNQAIENGFYYARSGAFSSAADWISPCPVPVDTNTVLRFSNRLQLVSPAQNEFAESGALFLINAGAEGTYDNYVFVNVGYTMSPSKVFVELFGSDGGTDFDQYEETNIPYSTSQIFNVDLWILPNAYHIAVGDMMIDTVALASTVASVGLFETGVQQNGAGLRGLIDMTTIEKLCRTVNQEQMLKRHSVHRNRKKERLGTRCLTRNKYVSLAKERIKYCARPSRGMQILSKMQHRPDFD